MILHETVYLGDGAYLHYDGLGYELRANDHKHPTDRVYLEHGHVVQELLRNIKETEAEIKAEREQRKS